MLRISLFIAPNLSEAPGQSRLYLSIRHSRCTYIIGIGNAMVEKSVRPLGGSSTNIATMGSVWLIPEETFNRYQRLLTYRTCTLPIERVLPAGDVQSFY